MFFDEIVPLLFVLGTGIFCLYRARKIKMGHYRKVFLREKGPYSLSGMPYALIPIGLTCCGVVLSDVLRLIAGAEENTGLNAIIGNLSLCGGAASMLIFTWLRPDFLKPQWLLWLEANYDRTVIDFMFTHARRAPEEWLRRTHNQKGLEDWAEEMELRHRRLATLSRGT